MVRWLIAVAALVAYVCAQQSAQGQSASARPLLPTGKPHAPREKMFQVQAPTNDRAARSRPKRDAFGNQAPYYVEAARMRKSHPVKRQYDGGYSAVPAPQNPGISKPTPVQPEPRPSYEEPVPPPAPAPAPAPAPSYEEAPPPAPQPQPPMGSGGPGNDEAEATRYYYPPRFPLPLAKCFHNPTGYVCCNAQLNDLMVQTITDLEARPKFHTCNLQKLANELNDRASKAFNATFETLVSFEDYAQRIHFKGDLVCKVELGGRYMLAYSAPSGVTEAQLPPPPDAVTGPVEEHHISRRHSVRMYPKNPVPIRRARMQSGRMAA